MQAKEKIPLFLSIKNFYSQWGATFILILLAAMWLIYSKPLANIDRLWSDSIFFKQQKNVSPDIVVVNITQSDLVKIGQVSIDRVTISEIINKAADFEAKRIILDFLFSGNNTQWADAKLERAIGRFQKSNIAFGNTKDVDLKAPIAFSSKATLVNLSFLPDFDGRNRELRGKTSDHFYNPAVWAANGGLIASATPLDLRLAVKKIKQVSLTEFMSINDRSQLKSKIVIVALDNKLSMSRTVLPIFGEVTRGTFIAVAANSAIQGYEKIGVISHRLFNLFATMAIIIGLSIGIFSKFALNAARLSILLVFVVFIWSYYLTNNLGIRTYPATISFLGMLSIYIVLAKRLRLIEVILGFLKGNMSPEEAWLWNSYVEKGKAAILFDASGNIKRINEPAISTFGIDLDAKDSFDIAKLCMPSLGERAQQIIFGSEKSLFALEWPHATIPLVVFEDQTNQIKRETELKKSLLTDHLTGLTNRRGFDEAVEELKSNSNTNYAILFMDMNGFKAVNDTLGHDAGDQLLKVVGKRLENVLRDGDLLARFGGDEYAAIIYGDLNLRAVQLIANKLEAAIDKPINLNNQIAKVGLAIGFALPQNDNDTPENVLNIADANMYKRKKELKAKQAKIAA